MYFHLVLYALLISFCPSHSSKVLSGDDQVGGNPTMNTPRLRREGGIASSSRLFFTCSVCVCVFIKLHMTAQSGLVILVILCHSR